MFYRIERCSTPTLGCEDPSRGGWPTPLRAIRYSEFAIRHSSPTPKAFKNIAQMFFCPFRARTDDCGLRIEGAPFISARQDRASSYEPVAKMGGGRMRIDAELREGESLWHTRPRV